jgi:hypothetical protein
MKIKIFILFLIGSVPVKSATPGELQDKPRIIGIMVFQIVVIKVSLLVLLFWICSMGRQEKWLLRLTN